MLCRCSFLLSLFESLWHMTLLLEWHFIQLLLSWTHILLLCSLRSILIWLVLKPKFRLLLFWRRLMWKLLRYSVVHHTLIWIAFVVEWVWMSLGWGLELLLLSKFITLSRWSCTYLVLLKLIRSSHSHWCFSTLVTILLLLLLKHGKLFI